MPDRDIISFTAPLSGASQPQRAKSARGSAWLKPGATEEVNARNPARAMRGPSDHQADCQTASHQAR
jgi:hypothetical protein